MHVPLEHKTHVYDWKPYKVELFFSLAAAIFPPVDVDGGVSEQVLNEREKSAATSIALASEMHFSNS